MRNIKDYGAVGDGIALDTAAIQRAIDDGGMVYIPEGVYRTGTLYLKSNGGLHLAAGAVLLASHDYLDYNEWDFCQQNWKSEAEFANGKHLIVAVEQENIFIEGQGTIKGEGSYWINDKMLAPGWPDPENIDFAINEKNTRPSQMLFICECKNVKIKGVTLLDSPYWHLFLYGCEDVVVHGLTIKGDRPRWTNDGIDIDACSGVTVSDCLIDVGDDGITLRAAEHNFKHKENICERVTITNCIVHSHRANGIRIGVGAGLIRNCILTGLDIEAPNYAGFEINSKWSVRTNQITKIENIICSDMHIRARKAFDIISAFGDEIITDECYIKRLIFKNIMLIQREISKVYGREDVPLENIYFKDIYAISDEMDNKNAEIFDIKGSSSVIVENLVKL